MQREPDEIVTMTYAPGATRSSGEFELRERVVRIQGNGYFRDILLREKQVYRERRDDWFGWFLDHGIAIQAFFLGCVVGVALCAAVNSI